MSPMVRRVASRVVLAGLVTAIALWIVSRTDGGGTVGWIVDARAVAGDATAIEVTIADGPRVLAAHSGIRLDAPIRLTTPVPRGEVTVTVDLTTAAGARRVVRTARPSRGATVELLVGE